jgi:hypothetical protein
MTDNASRRIKEKRGYSMRTSAKKLCLSVFALTLLSAAILGASDKPGKSKGHENDGTISVAEPATIVLLGAGLVSLGIYARRKKSSK